MEVLILRASSGIGNPGIDVPYSGPSRPTGYCLCGVSNSAAYVGSSEWAGVSDIRGGAAEAGAVNNGLGLSEPEVLVVELDAPEGIVEYEGRRTSGPVKFEAALLGDTVLDETATAEARGAARVFLIRENRDETRVYEDWSCSSSSENGLKDVRLLTSASANFVLLLEREG